MSTQHPAKRRAFTLIEMLVVLAVAAIVTAITVGGFNEMRAGNKRTSCQANLVQIYQAARLYATDEGGRFPYLQDTCPTGTPDGIGLWALYTFPNSTHTKPAAPDTKPIERYVRSAKVLHCPNDIGKDTTGYPNSNLYSADKSEFNLNYLSYQVCDGSVPTYTSVRTNDPSNTFWQRQLLHFDSTNAFIPRLPADNTVVTWCLHHRNSRNMDNVLFYDGSVQLMPKGYGGAVEPWQRLPKPPA